MQAQPVANCINVYKQIKTELFSISHSVARFHYKFEYSVAYRSEESILLFLKFQFAIS